jgi:chaperonin cofactor prefoldin
VNKITDKITDKINAETDLTKITNQISDIKKDLPAIEKRRMELGSGDTFKDMDKAKLEEELVKRFEDLTK